MSTPATTRTNALPQALNRWQRYALLAGGAGLILCVLGALLTPQQFFLSYLVAFLFWLGIALGSLAWLLVYHLTGGAWGRVLRRVLETACLMTMPMALLFVPLLFGLDELYVWARPEVVGEDALLQHKQPYLNLPFFLLRTVVYFLVWVGIALLLNRLARQQEQSADPLLSERLRRFGGLGLAVYGLTVTFAAIDWLMSLDPHWFSSVFGLLVASGQVLSSLAFAILVLVLLARYEPFASVLTPRLYGDLGNLLLAATLLAAYLGFVQYLIIWSGDLPEEVTWYLHRRDGGWGWIGLLLLLFQFVLPFAALLSGQVKRHRRQLAMVATTLLIATFLHLFWLAAPAFYPATIHVHWLDVVAPLTVGALWLAGFIWQLRSRPLSILPATAHQETLAYE